MVHIMTNHHRFVVPDIMHRFFDDIDLLRQRWHSENIDTVAELYVFSDFFSKILIDE
jgi:hypothetical protein